MTDTHAHIDDEQYQDGFMQFLAEQRAAGVKAIVVPGINQDSLSSVAAVCKKAPDFCFPAYGLHPEEVKQDGLQQLQVIEAEIRKGGCVAIGEIGLDYYWDKTYIKEQQEVLLRQLDLALELNLPVLLHNRDATEDMLQLLKPYSARGLRGVMHCFTGSMETAERVLDMGLYLGIGGVLTFKNTRLPETLKTVPLERIVLETDSPYMAPVPYRGKRNEPRFIRYVIERLAQVYGVSEGEIEAATDRNARSLLNLK